MNRDLSKATELIKRFEGICDGDPSTVNLDPYLCPAGYWTIGWGHVVRDAQGRMLHGAENKKAAYAVYPGGITKNDAERLLQSDVFNFALCIEDMVKVKASDNQFCALVSFTFNVGIGAFGRSTLLRMLNQGNFDVVPEQFMRWTKSNGKELAGLKRRRQAECNLWRGESVEV